MSPVQDSSVRVESQLQGRVTIFPASGVGLFPGERRRQQRFPINAAARYILGGERGHATTTNISSGGVLLETEKVLPAGRQIQVFIDWPALLDQRCPLRLVIDGRVLRSGRTGTAVGITRYVFRLRPKSEPSFAA